MSLENTLRICSNIDKILEQYGNINFLSKEELYLLINYIRDNFNINTDEIFNVPCFCKDNFKDIVNYEFHNFNDTKIGGFLVKNKFPNKSYITVNTSKEGLSTLFDLTHEMIHFLLHPEDRKHYISSSLSDVDNFEWQANEGAAELLVPYKRFIPIFVKNIKNCKSSKEYIDLLVHLSDKFKVSTAVLEYRISGLKYEISQYEEGIPIDKIQFLSKTAQEENGIYIKSYNDIFRNKKTNLKDIISEFSIDRLSSDTIISSSKETIVDNSKNSEYVIKDIKNWEDALNYLKSSGKIILYATLMNTELLKINDNTVAINFINGISDFGKLILKKYMNVNLIEEQILHIFKKKMHIQYINKSNEIFDLETDDVVTDNLPF